VAAGAAVAPLAIELLGIRGALVAIGLLARSPRSRLGPRCGGSTPT